MSASQLPRNGSIATDDLATEVMAALTRRGAMHKLRAQVRAEVFRELDDEEVVLPDLPPDLALGAELIKEFMTSLGLRNSLGVFQAELGCETRFGDAPSMDRTLIAEQLGLDSAGTDPEVPLLVLIMQYLRRQRQQYLHHFAGTVATDAVPANNDSIVPPISQPVSVDDVNTIITP